MLEFSGAEFWLLMVELVLEFSACLAFPLDLGAAALHFCPGMAGRGELKVREYLA